MRKIATLIGFILITSTVYSQKSHSCEQYPLVRDSVYVYDYHPDTEDWSLTTIWKYENSVGRQDQLTFINIINGSRVVNRKWEYFYDDAGNRSYELSEIFREKSWHLHLSKVSVFNEDNQKLEQITRNYVKDEWVIKNKYYYDYSSEGKLLKSTIQVPNTEGVFIEKNHSEYYYEEDRLIEVNTYDSNSGNTVSRNKYLYNSEKLLSELIILVADNEDQSKIKNSKRRLYHYDDLSILREVIFQYWDGQGWITQSKYRYFVKLDNAKKVALCHNRHTTCVSKNAVKAHVAHGDELGKCQLENCFQQNKHRKELKPISTPPITIQPNPVKNQFVIKINKESSGDFDRVDLVDFYGKLIQSQKVNGNDVVKFHRGKLKSGQYYVRLSGNKNYSTIVLFK